MRREQVAQVRGCPIYVITDVTLIPLSSQSEAKKAIDLAKDGLSKSGQHEAPSPDSDISDEDGTHVEAGQYEHDDQVSPVNSGSPLKEDPSAAQPLGPARSTSVAEDVIGKKGQYGRFAERWFSKKGWTTEKQRAQGMSVDGAEKPRTSSGQEVGLNEPHSKTPVAGPKLDGAESSERTSDLDKSKQAEEVGMLDNPDINVTSALLPKLLRTTRMLLGSRSFFFSYELDITRRLITKDSEGSEIPLHKSVDPLVSHWLICIYMKKVNQANDLF